MPSQKRKKDLNAKGSSCMLLCALAGRPDLCHAMTTASKFSSSPAECHHKLLKGVVRCSQIIRSWGFKHSRPLDKHVNELPESNCQTPAPPPEALGEFNVDMSLPKSIGFVKASFRSKSQKRRHITGCVFTFSGGAATHRSETQTLTAGSSTEAEFIAACNAAKTAKHLQCVSQDL